MIFFRIAPKELNFIKNPLQTTVIATPTNEITFDSNLLVDTCLHMFYTDKQLTILRDYLDLTVKAIKCKVLAEKFAKPNLNLADIDEHLVEYCDALHCRFAQNNFYIVCLCYFCSAATNNEKHNQETIFFSVWGASNW